MAAALAVSLLSAPAARAQDPDPWLGRDKALHFGACAILAGGGYALGAAVEGTRAGGLAVGAAAGIGAGAGKELLDLAGLGDPSWRDFVWDLAGTAVGLAVGWGLDLLLRGVSPRHPVLGASEAAIRF